MNIFIWNNNGNFTVFETETDESIAALIDIIEIHADRLGVKSEISELRDTLAKKPHAIRIAIGKLCHKLRDNPQFKYCAFSTTTKL
jgi:hypothetical protein